MLIDKINTKMKIAKFHYNIAINHYIIAKNNNFIAIFRYKIAKNS